MPIYEEKLITPLGVRFTQEHIRTTFQDGRSLEESLEMITSEPGAEGCGYDIVLRAPFPHIEIVRWRPRGSSSDRDRSRRSGHWYTLDNRRLYCLQTAAVAHWPKSVGAVVQILYADPGASRKYDSDTKGKSVTISHSCKQAPIAWWDWEEAVNLESVDGTALRVVGEDDAKATVHDLTDAPQTPSLLMGLAAKFAQQADFSDLQIMPGKSDHEGGASGKSAASTATPSTAEALSEDSSDFGMNIPLSDATPASASRGAASKEAAAGAESAELSDRQWFEERLRGIWLGRLNETYRFIFNDDAAVWSCVREDSLGARTFSITYDPHSSMLWWGTSGSMFIYPSELDDYKGQVRLWGTDSPWDAEWVSGRKPRSVWRQQQQQQPHGQPQQTNGKQRQSKDQKRR